MSKFVFRRATGEDTRGTDLGSPTSTPRWAKVFGMIAIAVNLLFLIMMLGDMSGMGSGSMLGGMSSMNSSPSQYIPWWVKVSGFIALVVVLLFFISMLIGVGGSGSGRKLSSTLRAPALVLPPPLRKLTLTTHVTASVGWIGAVTAFLALATVALSSQNAVMLRGAMLAMNVTAWFVIAPLSLVSLLTGLVLALFTKWGLFRHYWILAKLLINVFASIVLLMYTQSLSYLAGVAQEATISGADLRALRSPDSVEHGGVALLVLLVATVLSVYKPRGLTPYGQRKQDEQRHRVAATAGATDQAQGVVQDRAGTDVDAVAFR